MVVHDAALRLFPHRSSFYQIRLPVSPEGPSGKADSDAIETRCSPSHQ
ncbi:unnamed protein product [Oikopleura dioica]|uniref:Uncharacterized protein n=1 Tax=Oikopleura dioica TaxID=34765 RepID=E4X9B2_OIKDI|nr:unnamed protein product [Oikopleura dioica]CBY39351.1 unnamed protein product [Oikopleura dioica]